MMTDWVFIDTNVLVYARDDRNAEKRHRARAWLATITDLGCARTNLQILNELIRWILKNESHRTLADIRKEIAALRIWGDNSLDGEELDLAWAVRENLGYQWFDCLLIAAAHNQGCRYFLTEDMAHGASFQGVTLIDPFRLSPDDLFPRN